MICDYCAFVKRVYPQTSGTERRHLMKRYYIHKRFLHKNPPSPHRIKMARVAYKLALKLYRHFKDQGVPKFVVDRVPSEIRPYVLQILDYNGVKVLNSNPFTATYRKRRPKRGPKRGPKRRRR